jgi:FkbM family methyltransferase
MAERGYREITGVEKAWFNLKAGLRALLVSEIEIRDGVFRTRFYCENRSQAQRAVSLWVKEEGTMAWIDAMVRPGERFLDIGANIGVYTLAACHRVGGAGKVYAIEPHKPNAVALMRNILLNGMQARADVLTTPLADKRMIARFNYKDLSPSSTGSQFDSTTASGKAFAPTAAEVCLGLSLDELIEIGAIEPPTHVKIDVDGTELSILRGMAGLLAGSARPRSIQVELNVGEQEAIIALLAGQGYRLDHRHFTLIGKRQQAEGRPIAEIAHNAVFVPSN